VSRPAEAHRVVVLSDGVFAIALTLLVLDVRVPAGLTGPDLDNALADLPPRLLAYALSFAVIGLLRLGRYRMFARLARVDGPLILLNLLRRSTPS
jgi:TMEM175 potassium channel family protein